MKANLDFLIKEQIVNPIITIAAPMQEMLIINIIDLVKTHYLGLYFFAKYEPIGIVKETIISDRGIMMKRLEMVAL